MFISPPATKRGGLKDLPRHPRRLSKYVALEKFSGILNGL